MRLAAYCYAEYPSGDYLSSYVPLFDPDDATPWLVEVPYNWPPIPGGGDGVALLGSALGREYYRVWGSVARQPLFRLDMYGDNPDATEVTSVDTTVVGQVMLLQPLPDGGVLVLGTRAIVRLDEDDAVVWVSTYDSSGGALITRAFPIAVGIVGGIAYVAYRWLNDVQVFSLPLESPPANWPLRSTWTTFTGAYAAYSYAEYALCLANVAGNIEYGTLTTAESGADGAIEPSDGVWAITDSYQSAGRTTVVLYHRRYEPPSNRDVVSAVVTPSLISDVVSTPDDGGWGEEFIPTPPLHEGDPPLGPPKYISPFVWIGGGGVPPAPARFWTNRVFTEEVV